MGAQELIGLVARVTFLNTGAGEQVRDSMSPVDYVSQRGNRRFPRPWRPLPGPPRWVAWPIDYWLSCVSLRSPLPSAFTMYTSRLCRKAIVRPSGDHAKERGTFSASRVSRRSPLPSAFTT